MPSKTINVIKKVADDKFTIRQIHSGHDAIAKNDLGDMTEDELYAWLSNRNLVNAQAGIIMQMKVGDEIRVEFSNPL